MGNKFYSIGILIILLLVIIVPAKAKTSTEETVVVTGQSTIEDDRVNIARDEAVKVALRRAVEQVAGTFINSETKVKNAQLISDQILTKSQGYVKNYEIIDQSHNLKQYQVKLKVTVSTADLSSDLEALKLNIKESRNPRIMVIIDQKMKYYYNQLPENLVETQLINEFINSGYQVIDRYQIKKALKNNQRQAIINGNFDLAAKLGTELEADLVIIGSVQANKVDLSDVYDGVAKGIESYNAQLEMRAINTSTAQIVTSIIADGNGVGGNPESAAKKALLAAVNQGAEKLIPKVNTVVIKNNRTLKLKVAGLSTLEQLKDIQNKLKAITGVEHLYLRKFNADLASFELDLNSDLSTLDLAYQLKNKLNYKLKVNNISDNKLFLEFN